MSGLLDDDPAARKRRKCIAIVLIVLALVTLGAALVWWGSLVDEDIEEGTVDGTVAAASRDSVKT